MDPVFAQKVDLRNTRKKTQGVWRIEYTTTATAAFEAFGMSDLDVFATTAGRF